VGIQREYGIPGQDRSDNMMMPFPKNREFRKFIFLIYFLLDQKVAKNQG